MSEEIPYGYCHCGCGKMTDISTKTSSKRGTKKGEPQKYLSRHNRKANLAFKVGDRFGRMVVTVQDGRKYVTCTCDCGTVKDVLRPDLRDGHARSCGCLAREMSSKRLYKHGAAKGGKVTTMYELWSSMHGRCSNANSPLYKNYGGRGITVCERWHSYQNFLEDMGERPSKELSIERKNNHLGYSPENCVWATKTEQARNRRNNNMVTIDGRTQTVSAWVEEFGISSITVYSRKRRGLSIKEALLMKKGAPIKRRLLQS